MFGVGDTRGEDRFVDRLDLVGVLPVVCVGGMCVGEMLVEGAPGDEAHHLHAQTDSQHGDVRLVDQGPQELGFELLAGFEDTYHGRVCWGSKGFGDRVVASGEDVGVESGNEIIDVVGRRGQQYWGASCGKHGVGVGHCGERGRAFVSHHEVAGDGDQWWHACIVGRMRGDCARSDDKIDRMSLRTLIIWVIIAGVLGGGALVVRDRQVDASATQQVEWAGLGFDPASVLELRVDREGERADLKRDTERIDRWIGVFDDGDQEWTISSTRVRGALRALATAQVRLSDDSLMQVQVGSIAITSRDGSITTVQLGAGRSGGRTPVRIEQRDESGAIERVLDGWLESSVPDALTLAGVRSWRDTRLMEAAASSISLVRLSSGVNSVTLERRTSGWWISEPIELHADQQMVDSLVKSLLTIDALRFVDSEIDETTTGLGQPLATIEVGNQESVSRLTIGKRADVSGDRLYARYGVSDQASLIEVATEALSKLTAVADAYASKLAGPYATTAVRSVRVMGRDEQTKLAAHRDGSAWRLGDSLADRLTSESIDRLLSILLRQPAAGVRLIDAQMELPRVIAGVAMHDGQGMMLGSYDIALEQGSGGMQLLVMRDLEDGRRVVWAYVGDDAQATGTWLTIAASRRATSN